METAPFDAGNDGFDKIEGGVMDDEGNIVSNVPEESEESEEPEEQEESQDPEEEQDEEANEEEQESIPFKDYSKTSSELRESREEVIRLQQQLENLKPILEHPKFKDFFSQEFLNSPKEEVMVDIPKDIDLDSMSESEVLSLTADISHNRTLQKLEPVIRDLMEKVETLTSAQDEREHAAFFADEKNHPYAKENADEIKNLTKSGLPIEKAYFAVCGPKLKEQGFQAGLKHKQKKESKDVNLSGKKSTGNKVSKTPDTMREAFEQTMKELGLDL